MPVLVLGALPVGVVLHMLQTQQDALIYIIYSIYMYSIYIERERRTCMSCCEPSASGTGAGPASDAAGW